MSKWNKSEFVPKNPEKCLNDKPIVCRSSWERRFCMWLDEKSGVVEWGSEILRIPYMNPFKKKQSIYIPDFFIRYIDKHSRQHLELIEVKPAKEANPRAARSKYDKAMLAINIAKWRSANDWCKKNGITFRVVTEEDLFRG